MRRDVPYTSNGSVQCWQNAPAVCLAFVPALRDYFQGHARPDHGTPMYMLQTLLGRLDAAFAKACSDVKSTAAQARLLFDKARGPSEPTLAVDVCLLILAIVAVLDDVGDWLRVAFDTKMGVFQSTGMFLNRILDKELVSLTIKESHECKRCSYKCGMLPFFIW
jgi:hypothetical protein